MLNEIKYKIERLLAIEDIIHRGMVAQVEKKEVEKELITLMQNEINGRGGEIGK